ncbi:MAG TPA: hypothetical protein VJA26_04320 [Gammaproteobacteria bacterium]|nr:hypothetical protein [Gammaproteobacteria bacterium]
MRKLVTFSLLTVCILAGLLVLLLSASIYTYSVLTDETVIAELRFDRTGNREYLAYLRTGNRCEEHVYPVVGDQWRVDAEFLKWKYWALLFGLESQYRLDRLEGRYRSVDEQNNNPNLAHDLGEGTAIDVVELASALGPVNFLTDATYGSSTYQDIDPRQVYYVSKTPTGIITRSASRPVPERDAETLAIAIERGCGAQPTLWPRIVAWTDEAARNALNAVRKSGSD